MTLINTNTVEDYLVATLDAVTALNTVKVQAWPDDFQNYVTKFNAPHGALLVQYRGSDYTPDPPEPNNQKKLIQTRDMRWVITIFMRNAFSHDSAGAATGGVYGLIDEVKKALSGKTVTGLNDLTIFYPRRDYFVDRIAQDIYVYEIEFGVSGPETE